MFSSLRYTILDILSDLTGIEGKKDLINILETTKPHRVQYYKSLVYRLSQGGARKIDIGYYNSEFDTDLGEVLSVLAHLWKLSKNGMLMYADVSAIKVYAVYKIRESVYCSYDIVQSDNKEIRVCEEVANYVIPQTN